ncbi:MAG: hypothetical protein FE036_01765 [Thermoplasmata archaeon]|nr:MAG: hypothetical protein FE036_01765 [Thermoplasmata archaeon]
MNGKYCFCILSSFLFITLVDVSMAIAPDKPINVYPENGAKNVPVIVNLSCYVRDEDSQILNVTFYWSNEILIGSVIVSNDSIAKIGPLYLEYNKTYYWYAISNDGEEANVSEIWEFTTMPEISNIPPKCGIEANSTSGNAPFNVTFFLWASDADGNITSWEFDADGDDIPEFFGSDMLPEEIHYVYSKRGNYTAKLIVRDDKEAENFASINIVVYAKPIILYVEPQKIFAGQSTNLTIKGRNFQRNATIFISSPKIQLKNLWFIDNETIIANVYASGKDKNINITVINPDGNKYTFINALNIEKKSSPWLLIIALLIASLASIGAYFAYQKKRIKVKIIEPLDNSIYEVGDEIVFRGVTEPPGHEDKIKWKIEGEQYQSISSGEGSTFVVSFGETGVKQVFAYTGKECDDVLLYVFRLPHAFEIDGEASSLDKLVFGEGEKRDEGYPDFNLRRLFDSSPPPQNHPGIFPTCRKHDLPPMPTLEDVLGIRREKEEKEEETKPEELPKFKLEDILKPDEKEAETLLLIPFDKPAKLTYEPEMVKLHGAGKVTEYVVENVKHGTKKGFEKLWDEYVIPAIKKAKKKIMEKYPEFDEELLEKEGVQKEFLSLTEKFVMEALKKFIFKKGEEVNKRKFDMKKEYEGKKKGKNVEFHIHPFFNLKVFPDLKDIAEGRIRRALENTQMYYGVNAILEWRIYRENKEIAKLVMKAEIGREGNALFSDGKWIWKLSLLLKIPLP